MGIFDFFKKEGSDDQAKKTDPVAVSKFDKLVDDSRSGDREAQTILYREFLNLEKFIFVVKPGKPIEDSLPFVGSMDNQSWLFIFTDTRKANEFAENTDGFKDENGSTFVLAFDNKSTINTILDYGKKGVYGIRINQGTHGWFAPIDTFIGIMEYLNNIDNTSKKDIESDFTILPIQENELKYIRSCAAAVEEWFKVFNVSWEKTHRFHPINIGGFIVHWFKKGLKEKAALGITDQKMAECLGAALGVYAEERLGMKWHNIVDTNNVIDGNVVVECGLFEERSRAVLFPIRTIQDEIFNNKTGLSAAIMMLRLKEFIQNNHCR